MGPWVRDRDAGFQAPRGAMARVLERAIRRARGPGPHNPGGPATNPVDLVDLVDDLALHFPQARPPRIPTTAIHGDPPPVPSR
jgi:hypothetical protein